VNKLGNRSIPGPEINPNRNLKPTPKLILSAKCLNLSRVVAKWNDRGNDRGGTRGERRGGGNDQRERP